MRVPLFNLALALVFALGTSAEPIVIRRREVHFGRAPNDVPGPSIFENATLHSLEKRFDDCRFTFYEAGLGACGKVNTGSDFIVALNAQQYAGGAHCGETITITYKGKSAKAQIMDMCPGCPFGGLDLTESLFSFFANRDEGVITGSWVFGSSGGQSQPESKPKTTPTPTPTPKAKSTPTTTSTRATSTSAPTTSKKKELSTSSTTLSTSTSSAATPSMTADANSFLDELNVALLSLGSLAVSAAQANS